MLALNLTARLFVDDEGAAYPITSFLDSDGDECGVEDAVVAVAGEGGCWFALDLTEFELTKPN